MKDQTAPENVVDEIAGKQPWSVQFWDWLNGVQMNEELREQECSNG